LASPFRFLNRHPNVNLAAHTPPGAFPVPLPRISLSAWLLILPLALFAFGCSRSEPARPAPKIDAQRLQRELRKAVEDVGKSGVWIKDPPAGESASQGVTLDRDVVVVSGSFERALSAARHAAAREGTAMRVQTLRSTNGLRVAEARFVAGSHEVCRWNLREVRRICRAAIIIDDLGNDAGAEKKLLELPYPLTYSVLPGLGHSARTAENVFAHGREVMLHLPMEPEPGATSRPGPGEIQVGMTGQEVARTIAHDLATVPHARGVNNHMGSRATADPVLMAEVMRVLAQRRLFFVDSRTTAQSTALGVARRMGVPGFYRSVFLDDNESVDYSLGQLREFRRAAEEKGVAIAIGHPHPTTIRALRRFLPQLERDDIELVPASELLRAPEAARLSPPAERPSEYPAASQRSAGATRLFEK
jgi:polysaccharide deacetylase 2 family uncharacterized protein YibQ